MTDFGPSNGLSHGNYDTFINGYDLFLNVPDSQMTNLYLAFQAILLRQWNDAAGFLHEVAVASKADDHEACAEQAHLFASACKRKDDERKATASTIPHKYLAAPGVPYLAQSAINIMDITS